MKKLFVFACLLLVLKAQGQTDVRILVRNYADSSAIVNAKIDLELKNRKKLSGQTDATGYFSVNLTLPQEISLMVYKEGFKTLVTTLNLNAEKIDIYLKPLTYDGEEVTVLSTRAPSNISSTFTLVTKQELQSRNFGQDLPILLQQAPSVVTTSDAGAGIGYTGIRIRGIDPTRINVTINGVPLNDAESQGVFWVNMPDFTSGVDNIQIQRGVGSSTNGSGAFGAGINIKTDNFSEKPFATLSYSLGSFGTQRQSLKFGTGKLNKGWYAEGRLSRIVSDGYIDRATSNLKAWSFSAGHKSANSLFKVLVFSGSEKTYQAWNGVPMVKYMNDTAGVDSLINFLWYDSAKASQLRLSDPSRYNYYTYKNETDNYTQSHIQLIYNRVMQRNRTFNIVLHGTLGKGYYENYEYKTNFADYIDTPVVFNGQKQYSGDLIRQRWLDNNFYGAVFSFHSNQLRTESTIGGAANIYHGRHFGTITWHEFMTTDAAPTNYYDNKSVKTDANVFWKLQYKLRKDLIAFSDMQVRSVYYSWFGPNNQLINANQNINYLFFNPKAGLQFKPKTNQLFYLTYGRASREPVREDFINPQKGKQPKPEFLNNLEGGYKTAFGDWAVGMTGYYMQYKNQLALTGLINDVGGYVRENIPKSHRAGIELEATLKIAQWIKWNINATFSENKINAITEYVDDYTNGGQKQYTWRNTDMAFSPSRIWGSQLTVNASKSIDVLFVLKSVSRQYLDNSQTVSRSLDPYTINDLIIQYHPKIKALKTANLALMVNNFGNRMYASNGYTFSGMVNDVRRDFSFVYPQAGRNFLFKIEIGF